VSISQPKLRSEEFDNNNNNNKTEDHRINQALAGAARISAKVCEFLGLLE